MKLLELKQLSDVKTKKHPPEGLFAKGSATAIAKWLKSSHEDLKGAMAALTFYKNRAGKNLTDGAKAKLDHAKALLHAHFAKKDTKEEVKEALLAEALKAPSELSAKDWQLYTSSMNCGSAAKELSKALTQALKAKTPGEAWKVMEPVMEKNAKFGAYDSEPRYVVHQYFAKKFGDDYDDY